MLQLSEIGKNRSKRSVLDALKLKTLVSPNGREYQYDYIKAGKKYTFIVIYKSNRMQVSESDYNNTPIDYLLTAIENELTQTN